MTADLHTSGPTPDLAALLTALTETGPGPATPASSHEQQKKIVEARLGVASGLFAAMRVKHEATAMHCLRVALGCSAWSMLRDMKGRERDALEIAALLHDVGKIGVPDAVLLKPSKLTGEEIAQMDQHKLSGQQILAACCSSADVIEVVHYSSTWFDGSNNDGIAGDELPLGSRMLAIVDAYDSMTTDHVYRRAMPQERVIAELFEGAGTQFDPDLVAQFCGLTESDRKRLDDSVASRWLQELRPSNMIWSQGPQFGLIGRQGLGLFYERLFDSIRDAVIFIDRYSRIESWNNAAERLTGISASAIVGQQWAPELVGLLDDNEEVVTEAECPVALAVKSGVQAIERGSLADRNGEMRGINLQATPVWDHEGYSRGVIVVIRDASNQISLEEQVQTLHERATKDPLTKVANRAEFDRVHAEFVETHSDAGTACSLVICDIDHFKKVNDNYGHQAGDEALVAFANVLQSFTRSGDLVARYGGEEFVLLCTDCGTADAARRAEEIRRRLSQIPQPMLNNMCITASFGVTCLQAGDTPATMLARADRALFEAKESGRNRVVQLGTGLQEVEASESDKPGWLSSLWEAGGPVSIERAMHTPVPMDLAVEKLRGFVADHDAGIVNIEEGQVCLHIDSRKLPHRRETDRIVAFIIDVRLYHDERGKTGTDIHIRIRPRRRRDRRLSDIELRATQFLQSLRAYFMASDVELSEEVKRQGLFRD